MDMGSSSSVGGSLQISKDVLGKIAQMATMEIDGVFAVSCGMGPTSALPAAVRRSPVTVTLTEDVAEISVSVLVKYGCKILPLSEKIQDNVKSSVQNMTGITVSKVNVIVCGIVQPEPEAKPAEQ